MPRADSNRPQTAIPPDRDHDIDLSEGKFDQTTADDLKRAFAQFTASGKNHLCVFFHGGLVPRQSGLQTAHDLIGGYSDAGTYPFFFIWNSGIWSELQEIIEPPQRDPGFVESANRGVAQVAQEMATVLDLSPALKAVARARARGAPLDLPKLAEFAEQFDQPWSKSPGAQLSVSPKQLKAFSALLIARHLGMRRRGGLPAVKRIELENVLGRVFQRINSGHGHGLYTTVIEELLIALKIAKGAARVWTRMKTEIDDAFKPDPNYYGGSAFLENLVKAWTHNPSLKVTLIGHSAGAIYVQRFVEALDVHFASQPDYQVEVITLAAAVSFARMHEGLAVLKKRASNVRLFGLSDKREGGYWEVPGIYNKSLLYIVCSLCEADPEADKPLVGMRRYWGGNRPYDLPFITQVSEFLQPTGTTRTVWAQSPPNAKPGYQSNAKHHGSGPKKDGFPVEALTNQSVCYALRNGI